MALLLLLGRWLPEPLKVAVLLLLQIDDVFPAKREREREVGGRSKMKKQIYHACSGC